MRSKKSRSETPLPERPQGLYLVLKEGYSGLGAYSMGRMDRSWVAVVEETTSGNRIVTTDNPDVYARENPTSTPMLFMLMEGHIKIDVAHEKQTVITDVKASKL